MVLYDVCSNKSPIVQNVPTPGVQYLIGWLVVLGTLRQYFSLYPRERKKGEKYR